jgi:hypothetical protein
VAGLAEPAPLRRLHGLAGRLHARPAATDDQEAPVISGPGGVVPHRAAQLVAPAAHQHLAVHAGPVEGLLGEHPRCLGVGQVHHVHAAGPVGLGGQLGGQGIGGGGEGVVLAGLERGAGRDHPVQGPRAFQGLGVTGVGLGEQAAGGEQEAAEGGQHRLAGRAGGDGFQEVGLEGFQGEEEEGFLGGEVVEHGGHRDLGLPGDVSDGDLVEAVVGEQSPGDLGVPMAVLLPLALLSALVTLVLLWPARTAAFWWLAAGFALMVAALVITLAVEVPIDNQIETWTAATLPGDWRSIRSRWELWHTIRTFASIAAVVAATVSAVVAPRPSQRPTTPVLPPGRAAAGDLSA